MTARDTISDQLTHQTISCWWKPYGSHMFYKNVIHLVCKFLTQDTTHIPISFPGVSSRNWQTMLCIRMFGMVDIWWIENFFRVYISSLDISSLIDQSERWQSFSYSYQYISDFVLLRPHTRICICSVYVRVHFSFYPFTFISPFVTTRPFFFSYCIVSRLIGAFWCS